jgi:hypothetical protein
MFTENYVLQKQQIINVAQKNIPPLFLESYNTHKRALYTNSVVRKFISLI